MSPTRGLWFLKAFHSPKVHHPPKCFLLPLFQQEYHHPCQFFDLTESVDEFEVFNQPSSPKSPPEEMGIQRKPQRSLLVLIENQPEKGGLGKSAQLKLPPLPPKSPPRAPQPTLPSRIEYADPKRRKEQKGKDVMETRRPRPTNEEEAQRAAKQQKVSHASSRGEKRTEI